MVAAAKIPVRMSVEEFLAWDPQDGRSWQLVDGEPQAMAPTTRTHGALQSEVSALLRNHLAERGSPCTVITTPGVVPRVNAGINVRIPDLAVTCAPYTTEEAALAAPVLVIELLSPSNAAETWSNVWTYTTIPSVAEILVLHTVRIGAELLRRDAGGTWPEQPLSLRDGTLELASIGFAAPLSLLYRTTRLAPA